MTNPILLDEEELARVPNIKIELESFWNRTEDFVIIDFIFAHYGIFSLILSNSQDGHPSTLTFHSSAFTM